MFRVSLERRQTLPRGLQVESFGEGRPTKGNGLGQISPGLCGSPCCKFGVVWGDNGYPQLTVKQLVQYLGMGGVGKSPICN